VKNRVVVFVWKGLRHVKIDPKNRCTIRSVIRSVYCRILTNTAANHQFSMLATAPSICQVVRCHTWIATTVIEPQLVVRKFKIIYCIVKTLVIHYKSAKVLSANEPYPQWRHKMAVIYGWDSNVFNYRRLWRKNFDCPITCLRKKIWLSGSYGYRLYDKMHV